MSLSLAMIVKNEAAHLGHCLDSVRGLVDEVVVVDTGSTDGTAALAAELGARVGSFPWTGDFSAARNASLDRATGDWILVLDADEALDPADHARIRAALDRPGCFGYRVPIRSYLPDGAYTLMDAQAKANPGGYREGAAFAHCGDTQAVRLFRREPWIRFRSRLHEMVDPCILERGLELPTLDVVIHHYGFTLADRVEAKKAPYLELARRDAEERPEDATALFHLLLQAATVEDWPLVLATAERYRAAAPGGLPPTVLLTQATALQRLDRHAEALGVFGELLAARPDHAPAALGCGVSLERLGRREEARGILEACLREHPDFITAHLDLADLHLRGGDAPAARAVLRRGLEAWPTDGSLWDRLVRLGLEGGDTEQAVRDAWEAIRHCPRGGGGAWHQLVAVFLLRQGSRAEGAQVLALGLEAFPGQGELIRLQGMC